MSLLFILKQMTTLILTRLLKSYPCPFHQKKAGNEATLFDQFHRTLDACHVLSSSNEVQEEMQVTFRYPENIISNPHYLPDHLSKAKHFLLLFYISNQSIIIKYSFLRKHLY